MSEGCCAACHSAITDGCAESYFKVGLYYCATCNSDDNPTCPDDVQGYNSCDACCQVECGPAYQICTDEFPSYVSPITYTCENGFPYYKMYASWRSGDLRNACLTPGGHAYVLDAMPAASIYNEPLKIPLTMYMAGSDITSNNTSAFVTSIYDDVCGVPCTRTYGTQAACPQPCGHQDCGYPSINSQYTVPT